MLISELKERFSNYFNAGVFTLIPKNCTECGCELEVTETLTHLYCPNPYCIDKVVVRTQKMFDFLGIKDIGESTIKQVIYALDLSYPVDFLLYEPSDFEDSISEELHGTTKADQLYKALNRLCSQLASKREMTVTNYIKALNLPHLQKRAEILFDDLHTLDDVYEFFEELDSYGIDTIEEKLNINSDSSDISQTGINLYETLATYKTEIIQGLEVGTQNDLIILKEKRISDVTVKLVCSDQVGGNFKTKKELYQYVDEKFGSKVEIKWDSAATTTMNALIWQGADGSPARYTSKVAKTTAWNDKGYNIPILTATQLIELLERSSDGNVFLDTLESL